MFIYDTFASSMNSTQNEMVVHNGTGVQSETGAPSSTTTHSNTMGSVTVGVDIGTTSVKALAVDEDGRVVARARVPHEFVTNDVDQLEHDVRKAWQLGPKKAFAAVTDAVYSQGGPPISGVSVTSMVPSLTAIDHKGVPLLPGLLYGDARGRSKEVANPEGSAMLGAMPDAEGFLRWAVESAPDAMGYWPCQGVATHALSGVAAVDTAMTSSLGALHTWGKWNEELLTQIGAREDQLPVVVPMCEAGGTIPGTETIFTGGTVDALCDQIVSGASEPGDVLAIFGATLVVWVVTDEWIEIPGLLTVPHMVPDRVLVGGPSNAGALFADWARALLHGVERPGPKKTDSSRMGVGSGSSGGALSDEFEREGNPGRVPVWLPYVRGERTPFNDISLRSSIHGLDITQGPQDLERSAYEASGFVIRRILNLTGVSGKRVVASGGGTRVPGWMAAVADATGLPVETVAVAEGAALGAAFFARLGAGLETSLDDSKRWARTGRCFEPDSEWTSAAAERFAWFDALGASN